MAEKDDEDDAPEPRSSSVSFGFSSGQDSYSALDFGAQLGLGTVTQLQASATLTNNGDDATREFHLGADFETSPSLTLGLGAMVRTDPSSLNAKGLLPSVSWALSSLWNGERETRLSLGLEGTSYTQALSKKKLSKSLLQTGATLGVSQDVTGTISVSASYTAYRYGSEKKLLSALVNNRKLQYSGIAGVVSGFPEKAYSLGAQFRPLDAWTFSGAFSNTTTVTDAPDTQSLSVGASWDFAKAWTVSLEAVGSQTDGVTSGLGTAELEYGW